MTVNGTLELGMAGQRHLIELGFCRKADFLHTNLEHRRLEHILVSMRTPQIFSHFTKDGGDKCL
jgi:hypothetical protein